MDEFTSLTSIRNGFRTVSVCKRSSFRPRRVNRERPDYFGLDNDQAIGNRAPERQCASHKVAALRGLCGGLPRFPSFHSPSCSKALSSMVLHALQIPLEIFERIVTSCELEDVSACSQTCRSLCKLIYGPNSQHLWRALYLRDFDDPRLRNPPIAISGRSSTTAFEWRSALQHIARARKLVTSSNAANFSMQDWLDTFRTLTNVALSAAPLDHSRPLKYSANTNWLTTVLQGSGSGDDATEGSVVPGHYFLNDLVTSTVVPPISLAKRPDIMQLFKFQCILGINSKQFPAIDRLALRRAARLYCYNDNNFHYKRPNSQGRAVEDWGPYLDGGAVNWRAIFYAMVIGEGCAHC
jgi:hypothetical protein